MFHPLDQEAPLGLYLCTFSPLFRPQWVQHPSLKAPQLCRGMGNGSTNPLPA